MKKYVGETVLILLLSRILLAQTGVRLISEQPCDNGQVCYRVAVDCQELNELLADIRVFHNESSKGTVILTTGGNGDIFYGGTNISNTTPNSETVIALRDADYETFEIKWLGDRGWATDNPGAGLKALMCAYSEIVRWIVDTLATNLDVTGATGNSGGGAQIGYGLAIYGLEELLNVVVLSGGPPHSDVWDVCFGGRASRARGHLPGLRIWLGG